MKRSSKGARLFAALTLPPGAALELHSWARSWLAGEGVRLLDPQSLHITLCFLGERPFTEIDALRDAIESLDVSLPTVVVGAPTLLPKRSPRTAGVSVGDPDGAIAGLRGDVERTLAGAGSWRPSRRAFHPHITLARIRFGTVLGAAPLTPSLQFEPASLDLIRSRLEPSGAIYETLARATLSSAQEVAHSVRSER